MNLVTFISDFGLRDAYVGSVKGMMLKSNPDCSIIDISHDIKPFNIKEAAYLLSTYYNNFPRNTVHLAVVDPGVGSQREPIIVRTANYYFVGPNNGLFSYIYQNEAHQAYSINLSVLSENISKTFHGRDIFGPIAALLAKGMPISKLSKPLDSALVDFSPALKQVGKDMDLNILSIDRFGNLVTNLSQAEMIKRHSLKFKEIHINDRILNKINSTYSDVPEGNLLALWGSGGFLEISVNRGSVLEMLNSSIDKISIQIKFE